jgi:hypothetical protein
MNAAAKRPPAIDKITTVDGFGGTISRLVFRSYRRSVIGVPSSVVPVLSRFSAGIGVLSGNELIEF